MTSNKTSHHQDKDANLDLNQIFTERRQKLLKWREGKISSSPQAYPNNLIATDNAKNIHQKYNKLTREELDLKDIKASITGRLILKRDMGKLTFAQLKDFSGVIQLMLSSKNITEETYNDFQQLDLGDIIFTAGKVCKTNKGELSIRCSQIVLISKSLRPLPEKFHGLVDIETRYRQRYLDLIVNEDSKQIFINRSKIINNIRALMVEDDFLEVETPMMHPIPGGAVARPFTTHHNALNRDLYLRVAPELYLKRLVVGGLEKVFEINRNFRNEGISTRHNPEFTMIEFYIAYRDYQFMIDFTEKLIRNIAYRTFAKYDFQFNENQIDLKPEFDRLNIAQAIYKYNPEHSLEMLANSDYLAQILTNQKLKVPKSYGEKLLTVFENLTEEKIIQPTFIIDYPSVVSPLARTSNHNPDLAERFELFIGGREIANGFSELNDPEEQANRFKNQVIKKEAGDKEAMFYDEDYITALEYAMPPAAGCGIGIDRLVMLLSNSSSIRDVILFPTLKN